ncbi:hypothetical protein V6N13_002072 [Hibiscus sabdariffa]|uniref:Phosphotyrosine protein phosphatase I domain-containing protein n=1 Tax=Hibiscus sabdariffa TaxID=183260 RepID=A0ABR2C3M7_9ROSI
MAPSASSTGAATETKPFSLLFVCLGNICRSPAAEGVFRDIVKKKGLDSKFSMDSAGTIDYHEISKLSVTPKDSKDKIGNLADPRMRASSKRRGIEITSISRPIRPSEFSDFDLILATDKQNRVVLMDLAFVKSYSLEDILEAFSRWKSRDKLPADAYKKLCRALWEEYAIERRKKHVDLVKYGDVL